MVETVNLAVQRNASITHQFAVQNSDGGTINLTGYTFSMKVKERSGDVAVLATATVTVVDAGAGIIEIYLAGSSLSAVAGTKEIVRLAYDLLATFSARTNVIMRGALDLVPGVS